MLSTLLIVLFVLALIGAYRTHVYSTGGEYHPGRALGLVIAVLVMMAFMAGFIDL